ncbi:hypothetical protein [Phormidium sp. CCY1219]|uniref:hypothetical protein n=1 Tax=Phormidium sp. CCY1219 TaxID=2886104 RepID=UPI002D1E8B32|nr:hypothetical protein [Phormidium sp. CCY1219]MEB3826526.1 hypothetical protein [Phormidium sp. CCY1219]
MKSIEMSPRVKSVVERGFLGANEAIAGDKYKQTHNCSMNARREINCNSPPETRSNITDVAREIAGCALSVA